MDIGQIKDAYLKNIDIVDAKNILPDFSKYMNTVEIDITDNTYT